MLDQILLVLRDQLIMKLCDTSAFKLGMENL